MDKISRHDAKLKEWCDETDCSIEIGQAIWFTAKNEYGRVNELLYNPTESELLDLTELAFQFQCLDFPDPELQDICFYWNGNKVWVNENKEQLQGNPS